VRKLSNIFEFFKGILAVNVLVCLFPLLFGSIDFFVVMYLFFGFFIAILFREMRSKSDALFYLNNGVTRWQLWFGAFCMNAFTLLLLLVFIGLTRIYAK
jgi:hypothetical protein